MYVNVLSEWTVPEIVKAARVNQAFQQVLDDPAAAEALQQPTLKPLLDQAADSSPEPRIGWSRGPARGHPFS